MILKNGLFHILIYAFSITTFSTLDKHPSGVGRLHTGCCPKGGAADPVLTVTLALQAEPTRCSS
ncbi:MAG: hypothetical protein LBK25_05205 [Treponema sp.]|nr:hypothetical protein [Treponema sp.]